MTLGYSTGVFKSDAEGYEEQEKDKTTNLNFVPKIGFFVVNNLAIGIDLAFALKTTKYGYDDDKSSTTIFGAGPFIRYYIPTNKVKPFIEINSSFGLVKNKYEYSDDYFDDDEAKANIMSLGGGIGVAIPLGDKVNFDAMAGYTSLRIKETEDNDNNDRYLYSALALKVGFTILLGSN